VERDGAGRAGDHAVQQDIADPDGEAFDLPSVLAAVALASLSSAV
jgi:hypothetical protein